MGEPLKANRRALLWIMLFLVSRAPHKKDKAAKKKTEGLQLISPSLHGWIIRPSCHLSRATPLLEKAHAKPQCLAFRMIPV